MRESKEIVGYGIAIFSCLHGLTSVQMVYTADGLSKIFCASVLPGHITRAIKSHCLRDLLSN